MSTTGIPAANGGRLPRLDSLTSLRFFAAFLVLQHHFTNFGMLPGLVRYTGFGTTGVSFFFVLSGCVLTWSFSPGDTAGRFYWRRFARIWPLHFLTTLAAFPIFYTWRDVPPDWTGFLLSIVLLHAWLPTASVYFAGNPASWSLSAEMFFYAVHPLIVQPALRQRVGVVVAAGAVILALLATVAYLAVDWPPRLAGWLLYIAPVYRIGEFLLGIGIAVALRRGARLPLGRLGAWPGVALLAGWFFLYYRVSPELGGEASLLIAAADYAVLPLLYGLVIFAAAQDDLRGANGWLRSRPLIVLGQWSYALYLVHALVIYAFIERLGARDRVVWANGAWLLLVAAVSLAIAAALYHFVEQPVEQWLRKRGGVRAPVAPAPGQGRQAGFAPRDARG